MKSASAIIVVSILFVLAAVSVAAPRREKSKTKASAAADLVWPGPPDQPRIRFVTAISRVEDVTGKTKPSLAERLAGRSPARDRLSLRKPYGVTVDRSGRVFVADPAQRGVLVFDLAEHQVALWRGNAQFPLLVPIGLAIDGEGRLFVSDSSSGQVTVFDTSGKPVAGFGKGVFKRPGGLAVDVRRARVYVVDVKMNQVLAFDTRTLRLQKTLGGASQSGEFEEGTFSGPTNVAVDSQGRLYVSDTFNCRIQVFDPEGRFVRTFGTQGLQPGNFLRPKGIAVDSEGHIYVADAEFNNFQIFNAEGKPLLFVGSMGDQPGQFLLPTGMAISHDDRIYVTEQSVNRGRLQIFQYLPEKPALSAKGN